MLIVFHNIAAYLFDVYNIFPGGSEFSSSPYSV